MSLTKITPEHIVDYIKLYYDIDAPDIQTVNSDYFYEALCETIVEENTSYSMQSLTNEWENSELEAEVFAEQKFDQVISDDLKSYVSLSDKETWVDSVVDGVYEFSA